MIFRVCYRLGDAPLWRWALTPEDAADLAVELGAVRIERVEVRPWNG